MPSRMRARLRSKRDGPMQHPVAAAWLYCLACLAISVPLALRRFRTRTAD